MNSIFKVTPFENSTLQKYKDDSLKELGEFFGKEWEQHTPVVFVVDDRRTINLIKEQETEDWVVGWSWGQNAIFILNPENISTESCHDGSKYNIKHLIKHELCHSFFRNIFGYSWFSWINEGVSVYVAGQLTRYSMPKTFSGFLDGQKIYQESGNAIKLLVDNFGKDTLFEFLKRQSGVEKIDELKAIFREMFDAELGYEFFNELKNKTND